MHFARGTGLVDGIVVTEPWLNMNSDCTRIKESPCPFVSTSAIMTSPSSAPGVLGADRADLPVLSLDANSDRGFSRFCPRPLPATELDGASSATYSQVLLLLGARHDHFRQNWDVVQH